MYKQPMYDTETGCIIILDSWQIACYWGTIKDTWYSIVERDGTPILKYTEDLIEKMDKWHLYISKNNWLYTKQYAKNQLSPNNTANEKD